MNSNQVEKYLEAPHLINEQDVLLLKKSVADFPYVGVFQMLYVKGLQNTKSVYYGVALQRAALVVNDRSELYEILHKAAPETIVTKVDAPTFEDVKEEEHIVEQVALVEEVVLDAELQISSLEEHKEAKELQEDVSEVDVENATETNTTNKEVAIKEVDKELGALENDILVEAINRSIQLDVTEISKEEKETADKSLIENSAENESVVAKTEKIEEVVAPSKFSDWLQVLDSGETDTSNKEEKIESEVQEALKSPEDLINKFISLKTTRLKAPKDYKSAKKVGVDNNVEKGEFVTETLANVYASQGSYLKAIKIYEQLSLTIPEKNTFFASRIRFLREKMEYDN